MFIEYSYLRQYNDYKKIVNFKEFYRDFMENIVWRKMDHVDYMVKYRFIDVIGHMYNILMRKSPKNILDVGCGNGINLPLSVILKTTKYFGLDYCKIAIENAKKLYPNSEFLLGDAFFMKFPDCSFDMIIHSHVLTLYSEYDDRIKLLKEASRVMRDDGVMVLILWDESILLRTCIQIGMFFGNLSGKKLPEDFLGIYFKRKDVEKMAKSAGLGIDEVIHTGSCYGVLESVRYLNASKFHRKFGSAEKEYGIIHPQNILNDLIQQSGGPSWLVKLLYRISRIYPNLITYFSIYVLRKM